MECHVDGLVKYLDLFYNSGFVLVWLLALF
jgi:hypothetical protein